MKLRQICVISAWLGISFLLHSCTKVQQFGENFNVGWQDKGLEVSWESNLGEVNAGFEMQLVGRNICAGTRSGEVYLINPASGEVASMSKAKVALSGGGACSQDRFIGITEQVEAVGLEPQNGALRWTAQLPDFVISAPQLVSNNVLLFFANGAVVAYASASGDELWRIELPASGFRFASRFKTVAIGNVIYFGQPEGSLYAVDVIDGFILWQARLFDTRSPDATSNLTAISGPAIVGESVCAAAFGGKIGCFSSVEGTPLWQQDFSSGGMLASNGEAVFLVGEAGSLNALDATAGTKQWTTERVSAHRSPLLLVQDNMVVVEDGFSGISLYSADTGSRTGGIRLNGDVVDMLSVDDLIVILTSTGRLYGLRLSA